MDTMAQRYALLEKFITVYGPDDTTVRPAIVLFHGCGGLRPHVHLYAQAAALTGVRAYVVDSFYAAWLGSQFCRLADLYRHGHAGL
jgi:dienelactone hydrolase